MSDAGSVKMARQIEYRVTADPPQGHVRRIEDGLTAFDEDVTGVPRADLFVMAYDGGALAGGLRARIAGENFYIKHLWVAEERRRKGVGSGLVAAAEARARRLGCRRIWVDTMDYQAPQFYIGCGYREAGRVAHFFDGHDRIFFRKAI